jgi:ketosteroid isomerase-like protein
MSRSAALHGKRDFSEILAGAVSQENVEIVRRWNDAFNDRDWDTFAALLDPNVEYDASLLDSQVIRGRDAVVKWLQKAEKDLWSEIRYEIVEATEMTDDGVLLKLHVAARGRSSDAGIEGDRWEAMTVRDGRITRYAYRTTRDEALQAAGLRE